MNESTNVGQSTVAGAADAGAAAGALSFSASREHPASIAMTSSPESARGMEVRILDLLKTLVEADRNRVPRAWRDGGPVRLHSCFTVRLPLVMCRGILHANLVKRVNALRMAAWEVNLVSPGSTWLG